LGDFLTTLISQGKEKREMKKFKTLCIGDTIYRLCEKYDLGKTDKQQVIPIVIIDMALDAKTGNLLINKQSSYHGGDYYSIIIDAAKLNRSYYNFDPQQNTHRKGFYFVNVSDANYIVRRNVINKINGIEKSIPETIKQKRNEILGLRSTFHEILNPSFYPDYAIV